MKSCVKGEEFFGAKVDRKGLQQPVQVGSLIRVFSDCYYRTIGYYSIHEQTAEALVRLHRMT